jgi:hypothetical protein
MGSGALEPFHDRHARAVLRHPSPGAGSRRSVLLVLPAQAPPTDRDQPASPSLVQERPRTHPILKRLLDPVVPVRFAVCRSSWRSRIPTATSLSVLRAEPSADTLTTVS